MSAKGASAWACASAPGSSLRRVASGSAYGMPDVESRRDAVGHDDPERRLDRGGLGALGHALVEGGDLVGLLLEAPVDRLRGLGGLGLASLRGGAARLRRRLHRLGGGLHPGVEGLLQRIEALAQRCVGLGIRLGLLLDLALQGGDLPGDVLGRAPLSAPLRLERLHAGVEVGDLLACRRPGPRRAWPRPAGRGRGSS